MGDNTHVFRGGHKEIHYWGHLCQRHLLGRGIAVIYLGGGAAIRKAFLGHGPKGKAFIGVGDNSHVFRGGHKDMHYLEGGGHKERHLCERHLCERYLCERHLLGRGIAVTYLGWGAGHKKGISGAWAIRKGICWGGG